MTRRQKKQLGRWRAQLIGCVARARRRPTPEAVHLLRRVARRLRAYCHLVGASGLDRELRWLLHQTSVVRDLDVIRQKTHRSSVDVLQAEQRLQGALRSARVMATLQRLSHLSRLRKKRAHKWITRLTRRRKKREKHLFNAADVHALRRTLRELQYCRQWLGYHARRLKRRQQRLGEVVDIALQLNDAERAAPGIKRLRARLDKRVEKVRHEH